MEQPRDVNGTPDNAGQDSARARSEAGRPTVASLIATLATEDGIARVKARRQLVAYRARAVAPLVATLSDKRHWVRWEAAKALSQIGNQESIQALLDALSDKEFDVRWLAAEGLIRIGRKAVVPILSVLAGDPDSRWVREGIHHVLHDMKKRELGQVLRPILAALEGSEPTLEVPLAARAALNALKKA